MAGTRDRLCPFQLNELSHVVWAHENWAPKEAKGPPIPGAALASFEKVMEEKMEVWAAWRRHNTQRLAQNRLQLGVKDCVC